MKKIIAIYNAESTILGEMSYIFGKIIGVRNCELCDITHGYKISGKKEFKDLAENFKIPIETLHINELNEDQKEFIKERYPIVILQENNNYSILMTKEDLKKCEKDPNKFFKILETKI